MPQSLHDLLNEYIEKLIDIYGVHIKQIILFGSYARGDYRSDSDIDVMILLDISDLDLKMYSCQLSEMTYDFNMDYNTDVKPIAKSDEHFQKWVVNYPFYANVKNEGVVLYDAV